MMDVSPPSVDIEVAQAEVRHARVPGTGGMLYILTRGWEATAWKMEIADSHGNYGAK